jgi:RNA 3'-terminal phosphate cyclase
MNQLTGVFVVDCLLTGRLQVRILNCAHVLLRIMPTMVGGTEVNVSKAGSYPKGKPEGDNSMTCKSLVQHRGIYANGPGSYAVYG